MKFVFFALIFLSLFSAAHHLHGQPEAWSHGELKWYTIRTEHFDIHYHDNPYSGLEARFTGPERTARVIAKIAEEIYGPITKLYNHRPKRIHFVIRDTDDYSNGGAYYYDNKIEIWASNLDFELRGTHNWLRNVIAHEFTHMVSIQAMMKFSRSIPGFYLQVIDYEKERRQDVLRGFPNIVASYPIAGVTLPVWFAEGTAQYQQKSFDYEFWDSHRDMILRSRVMTGQLLSLSQMSTFGKNSIGNESAYNSGYAFVSYLADRFGEEVLDRICEESRNPLTGFESAIEKATGYGLQSLYADWSGQITSAYTTRTNAIVQNMVEGDILEGEATGTFFPAFSPDGRKVAFISNKGNDYLSQTALWLCDLDSRQMTQLIDKVEGAPSWSADGTQLVYSKNLPDNKFKSQFNDIYIYDWRTKTEYRITKALRAFSPVISPDGSFVVAVVNVDGSNNLVKISGLPDHLQSLSKDFDDSTFSRKNLRLEWLTSFSNGRQIYKPILSRDGKTIYFDTSTDDGRDIARINTDGSELTFLLKENYDERSPALSSDNTYLYYSSDATGIYNIYRMDLATGTTALLTNVMGGAFYPSVDAGGQLAFVLYKGVGFHLSLLTSPKVIDNAFATYESANPNLQAAAGDSGAAPYPVRWASYPKSYDDTKLPTFDSVRHYRNTFLDFAVLPIARIDYGTFKPGFYTYSGDVLAKSSFFAGVLFNLTDFDRDLFAIYEYGAFGPTLFLELYNVTRSKTFRDDVDPTNVIKYESVIKNTFELREVDAGVDLSLMAPRDLRFTYAHSEYYVKLKGTEFRLNDADSRVSISTGGIKYFYGNDFSLRWKFSSLKPSVDGEINPRGGRKIEWRYSYNLDNLIKGFAFNASTGATNELYEKGHHHRLEARHTEYVKIPWLDHTLELEGQGGVVANKVDDFYNFFAGGLPGLKGYSYYSMEGNRLAVFTTTYRFPIWRKIDGTLMHLYVDKVFGGIYFGYGNAWTGRMTFDQFRKFKKDIGAELRWELYSFFVYPTRIVFNAVYGLDRFNSKGPLRSELQGGQVVQKNQEVNNGHEWRIYLTVLFGFSLFD